MTDQTKYAIGYAIVTLLWFGLLVWNYLTTK